MSRPCSQGTPRRDRMKCPNCRALIDDGVERCTFCGHYFKGSMMERYKKDAYDPTQGYKPEPLQPLAIDEPKPKFRLFRTKS